MVPATALARLLPLLLPLPCLLACEAVPFGDSSVRADEHSATAAPVARVVSLHDVTTEMIVALGASDRLVGIGELTDPAPALRAALSRVPRVAGLESILAVAPELVVGLDVVAEQDAGLVDQLRRRSIGVYLPNPVELADVPRIVRGLARRIGRSALAATLVETFQGRLRGVQRVAAASGRRRIFVFDCCDPPLTAGGKSVLSDMIGLAGGTNVFADLATDWGRVGWEEVLSREPELVVIHAYDMAGQRDVAGKREILSRHARLSGLPQVVLPLGVSLGGLRSAEGAELLATGLSSLAGAP